MKTTIITNTTPLPTITRHHHGRAPLPSGAVPLAEDAPGSSVCLMPTGRWIRWWPGTRSIESMPPDTQKLVMGCIVAKLGGTAAKAAERLGVSTRTVEAWRCGRAPLPIQAAYAIAEILAG